MYEESTGNCVEEGKHLGVKLWRKVLPIRMLKERYISYENALSVTYLPTLKNRRTKLCLKFALKCAQNEKTCNMFPENKTKGTTRFKEKYSVPFAYTERLKNSAIPSMARQLNSYSANT